jgi:bacterioferritin-associated ferredoxin
MFVCHCRVVTDRQIADAIACGARDECQIAAACGGAGSRCGGCLPEVRRLLADHGHSPGTLTPKQIRERITSARPAAAAQPAA